MRRETVYPRWQDLQRVHAGAIEEMREVVRSRGVVSNRDFATRQRTSNYRGRKNGALALYYLWRTGELMTHHRERFERVCALAEHVAPDHLLREASDIDADTFAQKSDRL